MVQGLPGGSVGRECPCSTGDSGLIPGSGRSPGWGCGDPFQLDREPGGLQSAAAAKALQSCPTLCDHIDGRPPGFPIPGMLQARTPEWVAISFSNAGKWKVKVTSLSPVRLSNPMDCSPPGSSFPGILQARLLEWGAIAFSGATVYRVTKSWVGLKCPSMRAWIIVHQSRTWDFLGKNPGGVAISFSKGSSLLRGWPRAFCPGRGILYHPPGKPFLSLPQPNK